MNYDEEQLTLLRNFVFRRNDSIIFLESSLHCLRLVDEQHRLVSRQLELKVAVLEKTVIIKDAKNVSLKTKIQFLLASISEILLGPSPEIETAMSGVI